MSGQLRFSSNADLARSLETVHADHALYLERVRQSREAWRSHDDLSVPADAAEAAQHHATAANLLKRMLSDKAELEEIEIRLERLMRLSSDKHQPGRRYNHELTLTSS